MNKFLHVGCGPKRINNPKGFEGWSEIRLDIDPKTEPDIVGSLTNMSACDSGSFDALYSSHNIEHIYPHEVPIAINEFLRVIKNDGFVVITCPDLQSVGAQLANGRLIEPLYESDAGQISAIDIIYGHRGFLADGNYHMQHKSGFTFPVLSTLFREAGFNHTFGGAIPELFEIWMMAFKGSLTQEEIKNMAIKYLP